MTVISLATEAAKAPSYPNTRFNARERKLAESAKAYVDTVAAAEAAAAVSDAAYGVGWNGVTDVAPSKNAVYDIVQTKQNTISMSQAPNDGSGEISIAGMTATGKVLVCPAEDLGNDLVFSHVVAGVDKITVYVKNASSVSPIAAAAHSSVTLWNILIISLS